MLNGWAHVSDKFFSGAATEPEMQGLLLRIDYNLSDKCCL